MQHCRSFGAYTFLMFMIRKKDLLDNVCLVGSVWYGSRRAHVCRLGPVHYNTSSSSAQHIVTCIESTVPCGLVQVESHKKSDESEVHAVFGRYILMLCTRVQ